MQFDFLTYQPFHEHIIEKKCIIYQIHATQLHWHLCNRYPCFSSYQKYFKQSELNHFKDYKNIHCFFSVYTYAGAVWSVLVYGCVVTTWHASCGQDINIIHASQISTRLHVPQTCADTTSTYIYWIPNIVLSMFVGYKDH